MIKDFEAYRHYTKDQHYQTLIAYKQKLEAVPNRIGYLSDYKVYEGQGFTKKEGCIIYARQTQILNTDVYQPTLELIPLELISQIDMALRRLNKVIGHGVVYPLKEEDGIILHRWDGSEMYITVRSFSDKYYIAISVSVMVEEDE